MQNLKQFFLSIMCFAATTVNAGAQQDFTGMPGDNFSLQGALEMFKQASSPEEFEKLINTAGKNVNNLDLNRDGDIDYIKVIDKTENNIHAFILRVAVTETENQDIAVIELEKTGDTTAVLQIVGDEEIFGEQVIVEASDEGDEELENNNNALRRGPGADYYESNRIVVNVFFWPSVRFVYRPVYVPWVSPWRWHHYPGWWRPWRPLAWNVYHPRCLHYNSHCAIVHTHRVVAAHRVYIPCHVSSVTVRTRTTVARITYQGTRTTNYTRITRAGGNTRVNTAQNIRVQKRGYNGYGNRKGRKG